MGAPDTIRLLIDPPLDGPTNMARDEALLQRVACRDVRPTMRLYQWEPATLSLGYFQAYADVNAQPAAIRAMPVVRRLTGGGAIVHADELTYSLTLPNDHPLLRGGPVRLYEFVHEAAIEMLAALGIRAERAGLNEPANSQRGPFLCFQRRHSLDVVVGSHKVLGSAQRRTGDAILQHGSLQLAGAKPAGAPLPRPAAFADPLVASFARHTGVHVAPAEWCADCLALADRLVEKYAGPAWTQAR
jgi:lipoyl(octanoyl) transferase